MLCAVLDLHGQTRLGMYLWHMANYALICSQQAPLVDDVGDGLRPEMLVSLTAPKLGSKHFEGKHHYIGGRFVPPQIAVSP